MPNCFFAVKPNWENEHGPKMRKATGYLANEQEILDITRFITTLPKEK